MIPKWINPWSTSDEVNFLRQVFTSNRTAFENYAEIVMNGRRSFDRGVDVEQVKLAIIGMQRAGGSLQ